MIQVYYTLNAALKKQNIKILQDKKINVKCRYFDCKTQAIYDKIFTTKGGYL
jgi:hypothetical protein